MKYWKLWKLETIAVLENHMIKDKQRDKRVNIGIGRFIGMQFVWGLLAGIARIVSPVLVL